MEMTIVTNAVDYRHCIGRLFHYLHSLPVHTRVVIHLPSMHNYRAFWFPVDKELYLNNAFTPVKKTVVTTGRVIVVSSHLKESLACDVLITCCHGSFKNVKCTLRMQLSVVPPTELLGKQNRLVVVEDEYPVVAGVALPTNIQTNRGVKLAAFSRKGGLIPYILDTLLETKGLLTLDPCPRKVGFVQYHFIVIVSSSLDLMFEVYGALHKRGVSVQLNVENSVTETLHRKLRPGEGLTSAVNVVIVRDTFCEIAGLLTHATQVIVTDTLVDPTVMKHLWLVSFSVLVTVYRVDVRFLDGSRGFGELPGVLQLLYPDLDWSFAREALKVPEDVLSEPDQALPSGEGQADFHCLESLPLLPTLLFRGVSYPQCQLTLAELVDGVTNGACTFSMCFAGMVVDGWLDQRLVATISNLLCETSFCLAANEVNVKQLWDVLSAGKIKYLSQIDWAALTTVLLCRVILPPECSLSLQRMEGEPEEFCCDTLCQDLICGVLWGVFMSLPSGHPIRLYDFSNSIGLCDVQDSTWNSVVPIHEINVLT